MEKSVIRLLLIFIVTLAILFKIVISVANDKVSELNHEIKITKQINKSLENEIKSLELQNENLRLKLGIEENVKWDYCF